MNRLLKILVLSIFAAFLAAGSAGAITFTDTTTFTKNGISSDDQLNGYGWGDVNKLDGFLDYVSWTHLFEFDTPTPHVLSGTLTLALRDDGGLCDSWELGLGWAEDGTWGFGEVDTASYSYNINASFLSDGSFSVFLGSLWGDFYIDKSDLKITYDSAPVPEPATMLLFGVGLIGIAGFGRKKLIKK